MSRISGPGEGTSSWMRKPPVPEVDDRISKVMQETGRDDDINDLEHRDRWCLRRHYITVNTG